MTIIFLAIFACTTYVNNAIFFPFELDNALIYLNKIFIARKLKSQFFKFDVKFCMFIGHGKNSQLIRKSKMKTKTIIKDENNVCVKVKSSKKCSVTSLKN